MMELIEANWPLIVLAVLIGLVIAWYVFSASRKTRVTGEQTDVLDEGAKPAARNQALIDSAPAAQTLDDVGADTAKAPVIAGAAASATKTANAAPNTSGGDDLTRIKGLGKKLAGLLGELGVTSFAQIAAWSEADIDRIDPQLGRFSGRIRRDKWVEQAGYLAADDTEGFAAAFGNVE
jgi:predicted flap endonuclease-1-like 5' DNA nuclease